MFKQGQFHKTKSTSSILSQTSSLSRQNSQKSISSVLPLKSQEQEQYKKNQRNLNMHHQFNRSKFASYANKYQNQVRENKFTRDNKRQYWLKKIEKRKEYEKQQYYQNLKEAKSQNCNSNSQQANTNQNKIQRSNLKSQRSFQQQTKQMFDNDEYFKNHQQKLSIDEEQVKNQINKRRLPNRQNKAQSEINRERPTNTQERMKFKGGHQSLKKRKNGLWKNNKINNKRNLAIKKAFKKKFRKYRGQFRRPKTPANTTQFLSYDYNYCRFVGLQAIYKNWILENNQEDIMAAKWQDKNLLQAQDFPFNYIDGSHQQFTTAGETSSDEDERVVTAAFNHHHYLTQTPGLTMTGLIDKTQFDDIFDIIIDEEQKEEVNNLSKQERHNSNSYLNGFQEEELKLSIESNNLLITELQKEYQRKTSQLMQAMEKT